MTVIGPPDRTFATHAPTVRIRMTDAEKAFQYRLRQSRMDVVRRALIQQAIDGGLTRAEAEAEVADRRKFKAAADNVLITWARRYLRPTE